MVEATIRMFKRGSARPSLPFFTDQCREAVMRWRWPSGFVCPVCAGDSQLRQDPGAVPVYRLSTADIGDRRNDFRGDQGAAVHLVSRHVPPHSEQGRHLQH